MKRKSSSGESRSSKREKLMEGRKQQLEAEVQKFCQGNCAENLNCQPDELGSVFPCGPGIASAASPTYAPDSPAYSPVEPTAEHGPAEHLPPDCFICNGRPAEEDWEWILERKVMQRQSVQRELRDGTKCTSNEGLVVKIDVHGRDCKRLSLANADVHPENARYRFPPLCKTCAATAVPCPLDLCYSVPPYVSTLLPIAQASRDPIGEQLAAFLPLRLYNCDFPITVHGDDT